MSRARRVARRHLVRSKKYQRWLSRRNHECRVRHWRQLLESMQADGWRKPHDQMVKVSTVVVTCRQCRTQLACSAVIPWNREMECSYSAMYALCELALRNAAQTIRKMLVPRRYRKEAAYR